MKVCIEAHDVPTFGHIPAGSLWEDDSPYLVEVDKFADAADVDPPVKLEKKVRKFGEKKVD